jgi:hypothetical protein
VLQAEISTLECSCQVTVFWLSKLTQRTFCTTQSAEFRFALHGLRFRRSAAMRYMYGRPASKPVGVNEVGFKDLFWSAGIKVNMRPS